MAAEGLAARRETGDAIARWAVKAWLVVSAFFLVGGAIWYARSATIPLIVAALVATQLIPLVDWAIAHGWRRGLAITAAMLLVLVGFVGLCWVFSSQLFGNLGGVGDDVSAGADKVINWLKDNDEWVRQHEEAIRNFLSSILPAAKSAAHGIFGAALGGLSFVASLVSGFLLMLVFLLYLLTGGDQIWRWVVARFRAGKRNRVDEVGVAAWNAATGYIRGIALVALIDTTVITLGMLIVGTPHVGTLALLTFVALFIPILGAWVSGIVIGLVTLAALGLPEALIIGAIILTAQQLDSMFVTPLVYQKTVNLHPIVTLTSVMVGSQLLGIAGAFLAVPMVAVGWSVYQVIEPGEPEPPSPSQASTSSA
jgi:predicted PurR-regulated permease PerM